MVPKSVAKTVYLIDKTISALNFSFTDRRDIFFTTSFGFQSSVLFALLNEAGLELNCLSIQSKLSYGGIERHRDMLSKKFDINLTEIDRNDWLDIQLDGRDFLDLNEVERANICRDLKRGPILDYIKMNNFRLWITGIRRQQTVSRQETRFLDTTDMGVVKIAPMASWTNDDVRRAMSVFDIPSNENYIDMCKLNSSKECGLHYSDDKIKV